MNGSKSELDELREFAGGGLGYDQVEQCTHELKRRILILSDSAWERRIDEPAVDRWLANFDGRSGLQVETERLHALYILSQFLYFGIREIRVLLQALYRDLFKIPLIQEIRGAEAGTREIRIIEQKFREELDKTRFMGVGNPSESGVHLLYYFRQENQLSKGHFMDTAQIFTRVSGQRKVAHPEVRRYVFLDDVCGSGETARKYSEGFLEELRDADPNVSLAYYCIFATTAGIEEVRQSTVFGEQARAIFELDETYKCLSSSSRYLKIKPNLINNSDLVLVARHYGEMLALGHGGGYSDSQLLLGFSHNIPDNTLPIIWRDPTNGSPIPWVAAFRRYKKV